MVSVCCRRNEYRVGEVIGDARVRIFTLTMPARDVTTGISVVVAKLRLMQPNIPLNWEKLFQPYGATVRQRTCPRAS